MPPTLKDNLVSAVRARYILVAATFAVLMILGWVTVLNAPQSYTSEGVVSFQPRADEDKDKDITSLLANRYSAVATSERSVGDAALAAGVSVSTLEAGLSAVLIPETLNLTLSVTLPTAPQALAGAQSVFQSVLDTNATDPYLEALAVQPPTQATAVPGLPAALLALVLAALSFIVAVLLARVVDMIVGKEN